MAQIPPAPPLPGEAQLEIFVYPDVVPPTRPLEEDNKFSDARRLEVLGSEMSEVILLEVLAKRWPRATAQQLKTLVSSRMGGLMETTVNAYKWRDHVRGYPPNFDKNKPQEAYRLFRTFCGAVYVEHGYQGLRDWIAALAPV
ncbi:hypothetical protein OH77DRAFT_1426131 [Trametes cingulata]|nr:hypothetical protein OH77DRAFT_1426131 [Trametes cingulata]